MYNSRITSRAIEILEQRRTNAQVKNSLHYKEIRENAPEIYEVIIELSKTAENLVKIVQMNSLQERNEYFGKLRNNHTRYQKILKEMLLSRGYKEDFLLVKYYCENCKDTGYTMSGRCECFKTLLIDLATKELNKMTSATECNFQNFDLKYYKGLTPKGKSFYETMKNNYTFCIEYAENFSERSKNLFIMGLTGLGKTHLSLAIANVVLKKGYEVICGSMSTLLQKVEAEHFGREKTNSKFLQELIDVDFLIMDDIGAEHKTEFNESMLYTIINTRINTKKVTLANSNLTAVQFDKRYNTRITSRMLNDFHVLGFLGNDIREQMKREKK